MKDAVDLLNERIAELKERNEALLDKLIWVEKLLQAGEPRLALEVVGETINECRGE